MKTTRLIISALLVSVCAGSALANPQAKLRVAAVTGTQVAQAYTAYASGDMDKLTALLNANIASLVRPDYSFQLSSNQVSHLIQLRKAMDGNDAIANTLVGLAKPFGLVFDAGDVGALEQACPLPTERVVVAADCAGAINKLAQAKGVSDGV